MRCCVKNISIARHPLRHSYRIHHRRKQLSCLLLRPKKTRDFPSVFQMPLFHLLKYQTNDNRKNQDLLHQEYDLPDNLCKTYNLQEQDLVFQFFPSVQQTRSTCYHYEPEGNVNPFHRKLHYDIIRLKFFNWSNTNLKKNNSSFKS